VAGANVPPGRQLDGVDILARIAADEPEQPRTLFWRYRRGDTTWRSVLDGDLKLIHRQEGSALRREMFDLAADPAEKEDVLASRQDDARRLEAALQAWQNE